MSEERKKQALNRAKPYQLILFPMNNGATNVYYILTMNFIAYYANGVLGLALMFATTMVTVMRLFDAVTDLDDRSSRLTVPLQSSENSVHIWYLEMEL